jgi:prephenate dehydrogenase
LWLDLTSIKQAPVAAMLRSRAEVAGLHPMSAPPKLETLEGRTMAICRARVARWGPWLDGLLAALRADCVEIAPAAHDRAMALVQGLVHAIHLVQADVLRGCAEAAGGMPTLHALRTVGHELDLTVTGRILAGNPAIYEDIQFCNPDVLPVLERLAEAAASLRDEVAAGDEAARTGMRQRFLAEPADWFGASMLAARSHGFERMGYLIADLDAPRHLGVYLPEDRPGSLRALLAVFERLGVNLASIHSSRTPEGELHFRIGLDRVPVPIARLREEVEGAGIGRVLEARDATA